MCIKSHWRQKAFVFKILLLHDFKVMTALRPTRVSMDQTLMCFPCFQYIKFSHDQLLERIATVRSFTMFSLTRLKGEILVYLFLNRTFIHRRNLSIIHLAQAVQFISLTFDFFFSFSFPTVFYFPLHDPFFKPSSTSSKRLHSHTHQPFFSRWRLCTSC